MAYEIKLCVHGVPDGNKTWGEDSLDNIYIQKFYSSQEEDVPVRMLVEVRKNGPRTYCYYTYMRKDNILAFDGRSGSYFALTVRIDHYYSDIKNIYNLLDASYNKFIVGTIVQQDNGVTKYLIRDFEQKNEWLKDLEEQIRHYIDQFSSNADLVPLSGFNANRSNAPDTVNLHECDAATVVREVRRNAAISVSPLYPSSEVQNIRREAKQKIEEAEAQAQKEVDTVRQDARRQIDAAGDSDRQEINRLRQELQDANRKNTDIKSEKSKLDEENRTIKAENASLSQKLANALPKEKAESLKKKVGEVQQQVNNLSQQINNLSQSFGPEPQDQQVKQSQEQLPANGKSTKRQKHTTNGGFLNSNILIPVILVLIILVILVLALKIFL